MSRRLISAISIVALLVIVCAAIAVATLKPSKQLATAAAAPPIAKAAIGQPAPNFSVATTNGLFTLSKATKPVFLEIFATWCPHCQRMVSVIDPLYEKYKESVVFVGVSGSDTAMDGTSSASQEDVLQWVDRFHVAYAVAYDPNLTVANLYLQGGFPTIAIIGKNKVIQYLDSGEIPSAVLDAALAKATH
jgi:thiol-disulfide isomerase/thioredoxin